MSDSMKDWEDEEERLSGEVRGQQEVTETPVKASQDEAGRQQRGQMRMQLAVIVLCIISLGVVGFGAGRVMRDGRTAPEGASESVEGNNDGGAEDHEGESQDGGDSQDKDEEKTEQKAEESQKPETKPQQAEPPSKRPETPPQSVPATTDTSGRKLVALTFDDGPSTATTPRLLDILKARDVKVTFFVLGTLAQRAPELVKRQEAEGHEVASHTPYHHQLTKLTAAQIRAEGAEMDRIFMEILGHKPTLTRPPYGSVNATVQSSLAQPLILWSVDPRDWADRNATTVCARVTSAARNGAIILTHDIHATTVDAVPCIIDTLKGWGYEFMTVSELAAVRGVALVNGGIYYSF